MATMNGVVAPATDTVAQFYNLNAMMYPTCFRTCPEGRPRSDEAVCYDDATRLSASPCLTGMQAIAIVRKERHV